MTESLILKLFTFSRLLPKEYLNAGSATASIPCMFIIGIHHYSFSFTVVRGSVRSFTGVQIGRQLAIIFQNEYFGNVAFSKHSFVTWSKFWFYSLYFLLSFWIIHAKMLAIILTLSKNRHIPHQTLKTKRSIQTVTKAISINSQVSLLLWAVKPITPGHFSFPKHCDGRVSIIAYQYIILWDNYFS